MPSVRSGEASPSPRSERGCAPRRNPFAPFALSLSLAAGAPVALAQSEAAQPTTPQVPTPQVPTPQTPSDAPAPLPTDAPAAALAPGVPSAPAAWALAPAPAAPLDDERARQLALSLSRIVVLDLRGIDSPANDDFTSAAMLFAWALREAPKEAQIARRWVEAAHEAGDEAQVIEATRAVVAADPADTVAQLRLLTSRLARIQLTSERMAAYLRLLGKDGQRLDPAIRSRLALDAALLAREAGDERQFVDLLRQSTQLDATNKDAAVLASAYFAQRVPDARGQLELLANQLYADPLDAQTHRQIRDLLASHGAWIGAHRFHEVLQRITRASGEPGVMDRLETLAIRWRRQGPRSALDEVEKDLLISRDRQARMFDRANADVQGFNVRKPEDVRLALELEELRVAAALATKNEGSLYDAMADMAGSVGELVGAADPARLPEGVTIEEATDRATQGEAGLLLWSLLTGRRSELAESLADAIVAKLPADSATAGAIEVWRRVRAGEHQLALDATADLADLESADLEDSGVAWMLLARAAALEALDRKPDAALHLRSLAGALPLSPLGAWAEHHAGTLDAPGAQASARSGAALERYASTIPQWIDAMVNDPVSFQRLTIQPEKLAAAPVEPVAIRVTLRSLANVPVGLGEGRALQSRVLLAARLDTETPALRDMLQGEVLDLHQRLRLMPGEELAFTFWPDDTMLGWITGSDSLGPSRLRVRAIQGFRTLPNGSRVAGAGCLDVSSDQMMRQGLGFARQSGQEVAARLRDASERTITPLLAGLRSGMLRSRLASGSVAEFEPVIEALVQLYPTWPAHVRLIALAELPAAGEIEALAPFDDATKNEADPRVLPWVIATRVVSAEDPVLARCEAAGDAPLAKFASLHRARLLANVPVYAKRGGMGVRPTQSPSPGSSGSPASTSGAPGATR
jgi:hypothetical protein